MIATALPVDLGALRGIVRRTGDLLASHAQIHEIDLNRCWHARMARWSTGRSR